MLLGSYWDLCECSRILSRSSGGRHQGPGHLTLVARSGPSVAWHWLGRPSVDLGQPQRCFGAHASSAAREAAPVAFQFRKQEEGNSL